MSRLKKEKKLVSSVLNKDGPIEATSISSLADWLPVSSSVLNKDGPIEALAEVRLHCMHSVFRPE